jgi:hypothetical protein
VSNGGKVLKAIRTDAKWWEWSGDIVLERGAWFCLRVSPDGVRWNAVDAPGIAHTSAAWVRVAGRDTIDASAVRFWLENLRVHRERLERFGVFIDPSARRAALDYVEQGRLAYERLMGQAHTDGR